MKGDLATGMQFREILGSMKETGNMFPLEVE